MRSLTMALLMIASLTTSACVAVDGGAVEAGWDLRFPDGRRTDDNGDSISCGKTGLAQIALVLAPLDGSSDPCATIESCRFPCSSQGVGTTDFQIPPAEYAISLEVLDSSGAPQGPESGIVSPGPVVRDVVLGQITSLHVNLIIVDR
jgi:hypothetical protein